MNEVLVLISYSESFSYHYRWMEVINSATSSARRTRLFSRMDSQQQWFLLWSINRSSDLFPVDLFIATVTYSQWIYK